MRLPDLRRLWRKPEEQRTISGLPWDIGGPLVPKQITPDQALSLVPVFAAARMLASQVASLPLQCYRKTGDTRTKLPTPSLFTQPSVNGTLYDWLHRCVTSLALRGNAFGLITSRDSYGFPTNIEWLHPDHVAVQDTALSGPGSYTQPIWYWVGRVLPREDLVHIPWFTVPGRVLGLSPIEACSAAVSTGVSAQVYTADWFNNGAVPPGKFRNTAKTVNQNESDEIKARLAAAIRSRKPLVYGNDWEYDPIAVSAQDAQFIQTLKLSATQIATMYGIPADMIGGDPGGSLTYRTEVQHALDFVKFCLRPWLELLESAFSNLVPRPQYVRFNLDALLRVDMPTRMAAYQVARNIGLMNIDECRALEDMQPLPDGKGQDYTPLPELVKGGSTATLAAAAAGSLPLGAPGAEPVDHAPPLRAIRVAGEFGPPKVRRR
jgi:HK97 family phage portal protein